MLRIFDKRIGFLVSYQTLIAHGGIGQFTKSFCELMDQHNIKVDIITDKEPQDNEFVKSINANIIFPKESLKYSDHSNIFMYGDTYCYERMVNFRNAIIQALEKNIYDSFICNTYETVQVASTMGIEDCIQIIAYTHLESQIFKDTKNPFLHNTNEMMRQQLNTPCVYVGTQSKFNQLQFDNAYQLPIPITESALLKQHYKPREGVLFIGRWEEGKNPELYLDLIEQTQLPARIMTSHNGAKKFEERLKKIGVPYDIRVSIIGQEKVDFITSCRVAFNPSIVESYGMAFYEQITQLPTFVLENQRWTKNFDGHFFFETNKKDMAEDVMGAYNMFVDASEWYGQGSLQYAQRKEDEVFHKWKNCFNDFQCKKSNSNTAKVLQHETLEYREYIKDLGRSRICIDDIRSVLTNKHKYATIYTTDDTYLSKDPKFVPNKKESHFDTLFNIS
jgi:glycosyltransferase involved in cell wall biosynthesis